MHQNLSFLLSRVADCSFDAEAMEQDGVTFSWGEIYGKSKSVASQLMDAGLAPGERVLILADHGIVQVLGLFGVTLAGGVYVISNTVLKADQIQHQVIDSESLFVIGTSSSISALEGWFAERNVTAICLDDVSAVASSTCSSVAFPGFSAIPADVASIVYTSGSTGKPKGVVVPHKTLVDGARIVSGYLGITKTDKLLSILPLNFDYGLNQVLSVVYVGAYISFHNYLSPLDFFQKIETLAITAFAAVPTLWPKLLNPRFAKYDYDLSSVRYVTTAGGTHSQDILKKVSALFLNADVIVMYGLTESFRSTYLPFAECFNRPGSIGKPVPEVDILVLDVDGNRCGPGERGELYHRGAFVNYGYLNAPDLTASKYIELPQKFAGCRPEIIVRSGDLVSRDEDGYLYFHGRIDAQIKSMGYRVSPGEIEELAYCFENIHQVAVVGLPDDEFGEAVTLVYTTHDDAEIASDVFDRHFSEHLPFFSRPRRYVKMAAIPLTQTQKVNYSALKDQLINDGEA